MNERVIVHWIAWAPNIQWHFSNWRKGNHREPVSFYRLITRHRLHGSRHRSRRIPNSFNRLHPASKRKSRTCLTAAKAPTALPRTRFIYGRRVVCKLQVHTRFKWAQIKRSNCIFVFQMRKWEWALHATDLTGTKIYGRLAVRMDEHTAISERRECFLYRKRLPFPMWIKFVFISIRETRKRITQTIFSVSILLIHWHRAHFKSIYMGSFCSLRL